MSANIKLGIIVTVIISLAILIIYTGINDPYYETDETLTTTIVNKYYSTGKMGGSYTMRLEAKDGEIINYPVDPNNDYLQIGDKVTLKIYKRKNSGAIKYLRN